MSVLVKEFRGEILENTHHGRICIVEEAGKAVRSIGDISLTTYYRSSSKPLQMLPVLELGLEKEYGFTDEEAVLMAASHAGEPFHLEAILSMLQKADLPEEDLIMLPTYPAAPAEKERMLRQGLPPRKALHNCAGKHIGAMLLARRLTGSHLDYWKPENPAQQRILETISCLSSYPMGQIGIGVDGCGVPVFAVPMENMALSYLKLACPELIESPSLRRAAARTAALMHQYPQMIRGTGYLCSIMNADPNIVAKGGAEGVYAFALIKERLGISLKIEDGSEGSWPFLILEILRQLHYSNPETLGHLEGLAQTVKVNDNGQPAGRIETCFKI